MEKPENYDGSMGEWDELTEEQKYIACLQCEYSLDLGMWQDLYPWLTWDLVQAASRYLDQNQKGWRGPGIFGDSELVIQTADFLRSRSEPILQRELETRTEDGVYSEDDHETLLEQASKFGLGKAEINNLRLRAVGEAMESIKKRFYETAHVTDEDLKELAEISRKYDVKIAHEPLVKMCREIYLMEVKNELPVAPVSCAHFLPDRGEDVYYAITANWLQHRSGTAGFSRISSSTPNKELTVLARGMLYITSKRLVFIGDQRNTTVSFRRMLGTSVFSDAIEIEKTAGSSDYFSMDAIHARYVSALVRVIKLR